MSLGNSGHLDFSSFANHSVATSRAKIAAPIRAALRMSRLETFENIMANEPRRDRGDKRDAEGSQNVDDPIIHLQICAPLRVNAVFSGTGNLIL